MPTAFAAELDRRALLAALGGGLLMPSLARAQAEPDTGALATERDSSRRISTEVSINGQGPFNFVIDTGANTSVIAREVAVRLGLPYGRPARVHGIAGAVMTQTVDVRSLKAGVINLSLKGLPILGEYDLGTQGLLGIDFFRGRQLTLDMVHNVARISRSNDFGTPDWTLPGKMHSDITVKAVQRSGQLTIVDAMAARARISCFIDTGAQRTVGNMAMRRAVQARTGDRNFSPVAVRIFGATGQAVEGEVAEVPTMRIGGVGFTSFNMAFADLHTFSLWNLQDRPALMIGMDIMRVFDAVTIDFGQKTVRFRLAQFNGAAIA